MDSCQKKSVVITSTIAAQCLNFAITLINSSAIAYYPSIQYLGKSMQLSSTDLGMNSALKGGACCDEALIANNDEDDDPIVPTPKDSGHSNEDDEDDDPIVPNPVAVDIAILNRLW